MFNLQVTSTTMELLPLVCLCLLTRSGTTFAEEGPNVIRVEEDSDVTLPCSLSTKENIELKRFDWKKDGQKEVFLYDGGDHYNNSRAGQDEQFKDRVSHFPDKLKHGDASIKINKTKVNDSGDYTCAFPRLQPRQIFHIRLAVVVGAAPKPYVKKFETKDGRLLLCVVLDASPKPKVEWQDRAGNILPAEETQVSERGGRYVIILQTTVTKTDRYRCVATQEEINHQIYAEIDVDIRGPKFIKVEEDSDVTLPCSLSSKENIEFKLFDWTKDGQKDVFLYEAGDHSNNGHEGQDEQFKGRVSHFPDRLEHGDASIIIRNTKVADSGNYTCAFPRLQPSQIFHIRLVVGAAPEPSVTILDQTNDWSLLQCKVQGASSKPKVEWQDSAGNILPAGEPQASETGGRYNIILQTTVTKTDRYRCVATQEEIYHQTDATIYVHISGRILMDGPGRILTDGSGENNTGLKDGESGSSTGWVVAALCGLLVGVVVGGAVVFLARRYTRRRSTQNSQRGSPQETSFPLNGGSQTSRPQPSGQPPDPETEPALHVL